MKRTFRITDERDLSMAETLARCEGGRSTTPTRSILKLAKSEAVKIIARLGKFGATGVYLWLEDGVSLTYLREVRP